MESRRPAPAVGPPPSLDASVFAARRERLLGLIGAGVAVVPAAPELFKSRDTEVVYRPSSDLYYLSGIEEPDAVGVFTPHDPEHRFTLFVRPRDPERERWSGGRLGVEGAAEVSAADAVYPIDELPDRLPSLLKPADRIHYPIAYSRRLDELVVEALLLARRQRQRSGRGVTGIVDLEVVTSTLRVIKDAAEIERIRVATELSAQGHLAAMRAARPGAGEWEVQAALESTFRSLGAAGPAFPSIVGAGPNATVLHYVSNASRLRDGDLLLIDAGAEWGMYAGDVSRTFPVSGVFTPEQRDLYEIVLAAEEAAFAATKPGASVADVHDAAVQVLTQGLIDMRILDAASVDEAVTSTAYKRFYPHQTSHWLGLDVHDVGLYRDGGEAVPLEPGMVLTLEPGVYIPADAEDVPEIFRGVGIRIEDDALVTTDGAELLTRSAPVTISEIEAYMGGE